MSLVVAKVEEMMVEVVEAAVVIILECRSLLLMWSFDPALKIGIHGVRAGHIKYVRRQQSPP